jgi:hypothetical protein
MVAWDTLPAHPRPYSWKTNLLACNYKVTELTNNLLLIQLLMSLITLILPRNSWKRTLERFCQNVSELVHSAHQFQLNLATVDLLSVEVVLHLYVLASAMKNRILTQGNR